MPDTTPKLGLPFPLPEDALVDYPALGQQLSTMLEDLFELAVQRAVLNTVGAGVFTTPAHAVALLVELTGAGAGGAGFVAPTAGQVGIGLSGGGGSYSASLLRPPLAPTYNYVVPAGGAGGPNGGPAGGATGPDATFGTLVAKGGVGTGTLVAPAAPPLVVGNAAGFGGPGSGSVGSVIIGGGYAERGFALSPTQAVGSRGGQGAGPYGGPPNARRWMSSAGAQGGAGGPAYGAGGNGGLGSSSTTGGGAGGQGLIVVTAFFAATLAIAAELALEELEQELLIGKPGEPILWTPA